MAEVEVLKSTWVKKGATLGDKSARKEFGLIQEEIIMGIRGGKLHYQENNVYGNPFLRLIRSEVEAFVDEKIFAAAILDDLGTGDGVILWNIHRAKKSQGSLDQIRP
jgi:hypothetical protein